MKAYRTMEQSLDRIFCLGYGPWGTGKTRFSWTWPDPIILEVSPGELIGARVAHIDLPVLRPERWEDIQQFYGNPEKVIEQYFPGYKPKTVVIDTLSQLSDTVCMNHILGQKSGDKSAYATIQDIGHVVQKMRGFFVLSQELPYNVVVLMHERTDKDELTGRIDTQPNMYGTSMRSSCGTYVDLVLHFQQERRSATPDNPNTKQFVAYPCRDNIAQGKDRFDCLPDRMVNPRYSEIRRLIDAKEKENAAKLR
jgi:hypothetical protein